MVFVVEHTNLSIFEGNEYTLDVSRLFDFKLTDISNLTWHTLDEINSTLVKERVNVLVHSRDD